MEGRPAPKSLQVGDFDVDTDGHEDYNNLNSMDDLEPDDSWRESLTSRA